MRRKEKEIKDKEAIEEILKKADVCRMALSYKDKPYIVPVNFVYKDSAIFIHSAKKGKKLDVIRKNNKVCFEVDIESEIVLSSNPCNCTTKYQSVIGYGKAFILDKKEEIKLALDILVGKYYEDKSNKEFEYKKGCIENTNIIKIEVESISGKKSG